jgi:hypothetical protein
MTFISTRRIARLIPVFATLVIVFGGAAPARAEETCAQDLGACYGRAAGISDFWERASYGFDCEWTFAACAGRALLEA